MLSRWAKALGLLVPERTGRLSAGGGMRLGFGGAESNVAIGVARLGGRSGWAGRLGADSLGDLILRELRGEGVATLRRASPGVTRSC